MRWLVALLACIGMAQAQIIQHQISDDGYVRVPLQFPFPYYGQVFTESYMFSNGVVGFLNPTNSWCCSGFDLRTTNGTPFNFAIMPLQTDLLNYSGRFLTEGTPQYQRYVWENISEFGVPQNLNTFGVEIRPSGYIGMHYEQVNISPYRPVTIGMTGNTGEYTQHYHGAGFSTNQPFSHITESTGSPCLTNPLFSPSCSGYQEAYLIQQCSISALYSQQCPNYQQAYFDQQCSLNALYDPSCSGYEQAYFTQQCTINALYNSQCQGYAEAYALANIVTPSTPINVPTVQLSTSGTITVETPVIADPVVNEVIVRRETPAVTTTRTVEQPVQESKKEEKKEEKKEVAQVRQAPRTANIITKPVETPVGSVPVIASAEIPKGFDIMDLSHRKLIANLPSIKENAKIRWLMQDSDSRHREMVNGQWNR
jgi:hypothetical protein